MSKIATTLFQGTSTEKLPVPDIYNSPTIDMLSESVTGVKSVLSDVFTSVRKKGFDLTDLARMVDVKAGKISLDPAAAKARLNSLLGVNINSIKDLPQLVQTQAATKLSALAGVDVNKITTNTGEILRVVDGVNAMDVQGVINGVKTVLKDTGLEDIVDSVAQMSFLGSLAEYATQWGLVDTIDIIVNKFERGTPERDYLEYTLSNSFQATIYTGSLDTMATIINSTGKDKLLALYPNAISMILNGFVFASDTVQADYPALLVKFKAVLDSLDVNWHTYYRNGAGVMNLEPFVTASNNTKTLFSYDDELWDASLIAASYPAVDPIAVAKQMYPGAAISAA